MDAILQILSQQAYVSGEQMSQTLGITRAAVWKKIEQLRDAGWEIESAGKKGYHLRPGDRLEPELWQHALHTQSLGKHEVWFQDTVDSTNLQLRRMAMNGAPHGCVCLCEQQTGGKGRLGRQWISPPGVGLWQSVLLKPQLSPQLAPLLTLVAGLSMTKALETLGCDEVRIKWPNDLVIRGRKVCGILCEVMADMDTIDCVICGVGLNCLHGAIPEGLEQQAISLEDVGFQTPRRAIMVHYLEALEPTVQALTERGFDGIAEDYRRRSCTLGERVCVVGQEVFEGEAVDLSEDGSLIVQRDDGSRVCVRAGDVSVRGVMGYV